MESTAALFIGLAFLGIAALAILARPYLGLALTLALQPVLDLLPSLPGITSLVPLIGAVTIAALLINRQSGAFKGALRFTSAHLLAGLLILWMVISNPEAAVFGRDRNWFFTFLQLWVLLWLGGVLLNSPAKHRLAMWLFALTTLVSAIAAINSQGGFTSEIDPLVRATGLTQGANTAARYFVVAFVFLFYLRSTSRSILARSFAAAGMVTTFLGVFYTASRTGMILLGVAIILLFLMQSRIKYRLQISAVAATALLVLLIFSSSIFTFIGEIAPAIEQGADTVGLRYALWEAGWQMFKDHPLSGVGIGEFKFQLKNYPNPRYIAFFHNGLVAHNMYIAMLAETGLAGFLLFISLLGVCLRDLWRASRMKDLQWKPISQVWLVVLVVMLLGGMTKTDQVDKLLWLTMGVSMYLSSLASQVVRQTATQKNAETSQPMADGHGLPAGRSR